MTPGDLATLHHAAFTADRSWNAQEFRDMLDSPHCHLTGAPHGFALWRAVAGEAELLTIATHPDHQRRGIATCLMTRWMTTASASAQTAFLEVAADNAPAIALYERHGFDLIARRPGYYSRPTSKIDALVMRAPLPA
ncbi:MAG: GNAT family N-acetyltransferase [Tateyamaria sp.]|uniref:GNAT family N-acetyltransferase n=1 Tax=Tateyamaria sp. TaxID=1929288 RepID=UPI00327ED246